MKKRTSKMYSMKLDTALMARADKFRRRNAAIFRSRTQIVEIAIAEFLANEMNNPAMNVHRVSTDA